MRLFLVLVLITLSSAQFFDDAQIAQHVAKFGKHYRHFLMSTLRDSEQNVGQIEANYNKALLNPNKEQNLAKWKEEFEGEHWEKFD